MRYFTLIAFLFFSITLQTTVNAEEKNTKLPNITILATGGTIAGSASTDTNITSYEAGKLSVEEMINAVPSLSKIANVHGEQFSNIASENANHEFLLKLAKRVNTILANETCDGIVITHGTDTLSDTAYFLNLVVKSLKPVVLVGAMRPATGISADGPLNLLNAVALASSKEANNQGVLIAMNGEIIASREGRKNNTLGVDTFDAPDFGILGYIVDFQAKFYRKVTRKHTLNTEFDIMNITKLPQVEIMYQYGGIAPKMYDAIIQTKPDGIVIASMGNGSLSDESINFLSKAQENDIIIIRSSRTGSGFITMNPKFEEQNFIASDNLTPSKAEILLTLALLKTKDPDQIRKIFATY